MFKSALVYINDKQYTIKVNFVLIIVIISNNLNLKVRFFVSNFQ